MMEINYQWSKVIDNSYTPGCRAGQWTEMLEGCTSHIKVYIQRRLRTWQLHTNDPLRTPSESGFRHPRWHTHLFKHGTSFFSHIPMTVIFMIIWFWVISLNTLLGWGCFLLLQICRWLLLNILHLLVVWALTIRLIWLGHTWTEGCSGSCESWSLSLHPM